jgi:hypothetical protein
MYAFGSENIQKINLSLIESLMDIHNIIKANR